MPVVSMCSAVVGGSEYWVPECVGSFAVFPLFDPVSREYVAPVENNGRWLLPSLPGESLTPLPDRWDPFALSNEQLRLDRQAEACWRTYCCTVGSPFAPVDLSISCGWCRSRDGKLVRTVIGHLVAYVDGRGRASWQLLDTDGVLLCPVVCCPECGRVATLPRYGVEGLDRRFASQRRPHTDLKYLLEQEFLTSDLGAPRRRGL